MPSSDQHGFAPLGPPAATATFRPFGAADGAAETGAEPAPDTLARAFEAGRAAGRAEASADLTALAREAADTIAALGAYRDAARLRDTETLVALALELARKFGGAGFVTDPPRWAPVVAAAIHRVLGRAAATLRVGPRLAAALRPHAAALAALDAPVHVAEGPESADGSCRIERAVDADRGVAALRAALGLGEPAGDERE